MFKTFTCRASTWRIVSNVFPSHVYPWRPDVKLPKWEIPPRRMPRTLDPLTARNDCTPSAAKSPGKQADREQLKPYLPEN